MISRLRIAIVLIALSKQNMQKIENDFKHKSFDVMKGLKCGFEGDDG